jgi:hypothetical protein
VAALRGLSVGEVLNGRSSPAGANGAADGTPAADGAPAANGAGTETRGAGEETPA